MDVEVAVLAGAQASSTRPCRWPGPCGRGRNRAQDLGAAQGGVEVRAHQIGRCAPPAQAAVGPEDRVVASSRTTPSGMPSRICSFCSSLPISKACWRCPAATSTASKRSVSRENRAKVRRTLETTINSQPSAAWPNNCSASGREWLTARIRGFPDNALTLPRQLLTSCPRAPVAQL